MKIIKTALIDNSLTNADLSKEASSEFLKDYVISLFKCGVDYIETDKNHIELLDDINTSKHFIYRIEHPTDVVSVNSKAFAYAILPLSMIFLAPSITNTQIILEIPVDMISLDTLIDRLSDNYALKYVSMLRITGDFSGKEDKLLTFIKDFRRTFVLPLDVCPLNTMLCGLDAAFIAYNNRTDAITLCFGENAVYTSLEKFLIYLHAYYGITVSQDYVKGMCAAALDFSVITDSVARGIKNLNDVITVQSGQIVNIDVPKIKGAIKIKRVAAENTEKETLNFKKEIQDELLKIISESNIQLSNSDELKEAVKKTQTNLF